MQQDNVIIYGRLKKNTFFNGASSSIITDDKYKIISLRVEVSFFVLIPEIEDRDEVEVATGRNTKRPTLNTYYYLSQKKNELIYFLLLQLQ
jgi:hypothetical protein